MIHNNKFRILLGIACLFILLIGWAHYSYTQTDIVPYESTEYKTATVLVYDISGADEYILSEIILMNLLEMAEKDYRINIVSPGEFPEGYFTQDNARIEAANHDADIVIGGFWGVTSTTADVSISVYKFDQDHNYQTVSTVNINRTSEIWHVEDFSFQKVVAGAVANAVLSVLSPENVEYITYSR